MADPKREELKVQRKRGILVAVADPETPLSRERVLDELKGLVKTAGVKVVGEMVQFRHRPHSGTCLGTGKVEELSQLIKMHQADIVVFDNNLTPAQGKNLEDAVHTVIVDRSEVILDIFATHARTAEAKLQVELAQLLYYRTRLKRMWTHLERIEGGIGTGRGPGEKQIETDRRLIDKRVSELRKKLKLIEQRRERTVANRSDISTVSLVGYTNAGKSTLMNALTDSDVYVADQLFATLSTRTKKWSLPHFGDVLLSDTVGFVRNLPHHLVASFRSTLEEARQANVHLHVVDVSDPEAPMQIQTVYQVLHEIGIDCEDPILVFNKIDAIDDHSILDILRIQYPDALEVSAKSGAGLAALTKHVTERLSQGMISIRVVADVADGRIVAFLSEHAEIHQKEYNTESVTIQCTLPRTWLKKLAHQFPSAVITNNDEHSLANSEVGVETE